MAIVKGWKPQAAALAGLVLLAACETAVPPTTAPESAPLPPARAEAPAAESERSDFSRALTVYYQRRQNDLLAQGLMRTDGGGADTPFTDEMLARNFVRVALYDEHVESRSGLVQQMRLSSLRRWEGPVRYHVESGPSTTPAQAARDRASVTSYVSRLARATRHDIGMARNEREANFHVLFLSEDERLAAVPQLRELIPGIAESSLLAIRNLPRSTMCMVVAFSEPGSHVYTGAVAIIRSEHPDRLRLACIHEELAQGLGLASDHPQVRPSIFNDDEEFSLLTRHDELLLRILYDERLSPGMNAAQAAPIAREIARELIGAGV